MMSPDSTPCLAPLKSLRFGPGGRVSYCCHNVQDLAGIYPRQSLQEIWDSASSQAARKDLRNGKLLRGCGFCSQEAGSNGPQRSSALYERFGALADQPVIVDFKTEDRCNLSCVMCSGLSSSAKREDRNARGNPCHTDSFLHELTSWAPRLSEARFSGGEPFLSTFYPKIWKMLGEVNPACRIVIQTNGTLLDEKIKKMLEGGNFHINLSLDSFRSETYRQIRRGGDLDIVLDHARWFRDYCRERGHFWGMTACVLKANCHEFKEIIENWNHFGAYGWFSVVWLPPSQALWTLPESEIMNLRVTDSLPHKTPDQEHLQFNSGLAALLNGQLLHLAKMSELYYQPDSTALVPFGKWIRRPENQAWASRLQSLFPQSENLPFHEVLYRRVISSASPALMDDLCGMMGDGEFRDFFSTFLIQSPRA